MGHDRQSISLTEALALYDAQYPASRNLAERRRRAHETHLIDLVGFLAFYALNNH